MKLLPQYRSQDRVHALRIHSVDRTEIEGVVITPADPGYGPFGKPRAWDITYNPQPGMYYIVYPNGDTGVMQAAAFERRYEKEAVDPIEAVAATTELHRTSTRALCERLLRMLENIELPPRNVMSADGESAEITCQLGNGWSVVYEYNDEGYYQHIVRFITADGSKISFWDFPDSDLKTDLILWPDRG
jgi:hypothetical protein